MLWTIAHEILGEGLNWSATAGILTKLLSTKREGLILLMVQSSNSLGILLKVFLFAWNSLLFGSLEMTGHSKNMILLYCLSGWSILSLAKFGRFEANGATIGLLGQLITIHTLASFQSLLISSILTIKNHAFLKLLSRFFDDNLIFKILGHLSAQTWLTMGIMIKFWLCFDGSVWGHEATPVVENEIGCSLT